MASSEGIPGKRGCPVAAKDHKCKRLKFTGKLAEPIKIARLPEIADTSSDELMRDANEWIRKFNSDERKRANLEWAKKLPLLFDHYGIDRKETEADWINLVLRLVQDLDVPGFRILDNEVRRGRKRTRDIGLIMALYRDVELVKRDKLPKKCTDSDAICILTTSSRFAASWRKYNDDGKRRTLKNWLSMLHRSPDFRQLKHLSTSLGRFPTLPEYLGEVEGR
jgi:hypothetical protein